MALNLNVLINYREHMASISLPYLKIADNIPSVEAFIYKRNRFPLNRVDKAIRYMQMLSYVQKTEKALAENNYEAANQHWSQVIQLDSESKAITNQGKVIQFVLKRKVATLVYKKMEELLGVSNCGEQAFKAPIKHKAAASLKLEALKAGEEFLQNHWSKKVLADLTKHEAALNEAQWKDSYQKLIEGIEYHGINPFSEENPNILNRVVRSFIQAFDEAPSSEKPRLAKAPFIQRGPIPHIHVL